MNNKGDSVLFLIFGVLLLITAGFEYSYGQAFTLGRYNFNVVERGTSAYDWAVFGKVLLGVLGLIGFIAVMMKKDNNE